MFCDSLERSCDESDTRSPDLNEWNAYGATILRLNEYLDQLEERTICDEDYLRTDDSERPKDFETTCDEQPTAMLTETSSRPDTVRPDAESSDAPRSDPAMPDALRSDAPNEHNATFCASHHVPNVRCDLGKETRCPSTETLSETR